MRIQRHTHKSLQARVHGAPGSGQRVAQFEVTDAAHVQGGSALKEVLRPQSGQCDVIHDGCCGEHAPHHPHKAVARVEKTEFETFLRPPVI